jgi:hypothetical protein
MKGKETKFVISKSHQLNAMRQGYTTLREQRIFLTYTARINPLDLETRTVRFTLRDFAELCDISEESIRGMNLAIYKKIAYKLLDSKVCLPTENGGFDAFVLFERCKVDIDLETGEPTFEMTATQTALPYFFDLQSYFPYGLENVLILKSANQIRLYEILKSKVWQCSQGGVFNINVEELRELLFIEKNEYPHFKNFNQDVLQACQKAINELTDITFTYKTKRVGRKIGIISFVVEDKPKLLDIKAIDATPYTLPITPELSTKKKPATDEEIGEARKHRLWQHALEVSKNSKSKSTNTERYAVGILTNWIKKGYEVVEDLINAGEVGEDSNEYTGGSANNSGNSGNTKKTNWNLGTERL